MNELVIRQSRRKNLLYLLGAVAIAAFGCWLMVRQDGEPTEGLLMLVAGGVLAIFSLLKLRDSSPDIILNSQGLHLARLQIEPIAWSEISLARTERPRNVTYLYIEMADPEGVAERYPSLEGELSNGAIVFAADGYELDADDIADAIMRARSGLELTSDQIASTSSR